MCWKMSSVLPGRTYSFLPATGLQTDSENARVLESYPHIKVKTGPGHHQVTDSHPAGLLTSSLITLGVLHIVRNGSSPLFHGI